MIPTDPILAALSRHTQSVVGTWGRCPEQVRRRWGLGHIMPPGLPARIGTGVHNGAEVNHRAKKQTGQDEPEDVITDAARDGYLEAVAKGVFCDPEDRPAMPRLLADGVDSTVALARTYRREVAGLIVPTHVEETITVAVDDLPVPLSGRIDVIDADGEPWDIKTAQRAWAESKAHSSLQATMYSRLTAELLGKWPETFTFAVLKHNNHHSQLIETQRQPGDFDALVRRIKAIVASVKAGAFPPAEASHWICSPRWCGYYWSCPYIPAHRRITK